MDHKKKTLEELDAKLGNASSLNALIGLDGFVDKIIHPVAKRHGKGDNFERMQTITEFAERIGAAAGRSTNIELYPVVDKLGGNGPIMANALLSQGLNVRYIGALGEPNIHPVFEEFAKKTQAISLANPGVTHACEFDDGKIMFGSTASLENIAYEQVIEVMGEGAFFDAVSRAHLMGIVNWTMIPNMTAYLNALVERVLPNLPTLNKRVFFFDLCDPQKRSESDLLGVLNTIKKFQSHGHTILGLNYAEGQQVDRVLGGDGDGEGPDKLQRLAARVRGELGIGCVVVHPTHSAACATKNDTSYVDGPFCQKPKITTGAGDHFNSGFASAQLLGLSPEASLTVAVSTSGYYVRTAKSPSLNDISTFIRNWQ
ncbi:MAG: PfkB family carbohydrate kinase [Verrucomicrobiota bacterium]